MRPDLFESSSFPPKYVDGPRYTLCGSELMTDASGGVWRDLTATGPGLRPCWLADDRHPGVRPGDLRRLAVPCRADAGGGVSLGFVKEIDTADRSHDCQLGSARNENPLREFPHFLLLIEDAPSLLLGER